MATVGDWRKTAALLGTPCRRAHATGAARGAVEWYRSGARARARARSVSRDGVFTSTRCAVLSSSRIMAIVSAMKENWVGPSLSFDFLGLGF